MSYASTRADGTPGGGRRRALWLCAFCCLLLLGMFPAASLAAEGEPHIFNATLSLTGDCSVSEAIDPVPDPGCPGGEHPPKAFTKTSGVAVDRYGDRYVASAGSVENGSEGRIDVFGPTGTYITEIALTLEEFAASLAVDSQGNLYVGRAFKKDTTQEVLRYAPTKYNPAAGEIEYGPVPLAIQDPISNSEPGSWGLAPRLPVAIDPANDHLIVSPGSNRAEAILEFGSAAEGNNYIQSIHLEGTSEQARWTNSLAIDAAHKRLWVTDQKETSPGSTVPTVVRAYNLEAPHELLLTIDGSNTPTERFVSQPSLVPLATDEATGDVFVGDMQAATERVYEFDGSGQLVSTLEGLFKPTGATQLEMAYDNSPSSPTGGFLFVPSGSKPGRSLAFEKKPLTVPPVVEGLSVSGISTTDAVLRGKVNPGGVEASYRVEYTSEQAFLASGFEGAAVAGEGTLKPASEGVAVSATATRLSPGTTYRFRIVAESQLGRDEAVSGFVTYASAEVFTDCSNQLLRTGPSVALPDCRAYELVTPPDTNGHSPYGSRGSFNSFTTRQVSPAGDKLPFKIAGAPLSGLEGTGATNGDPYLATRTATGWATTYQGPSAAESFGNFPGTSSPDQGYSFWEAEGRGNPAALGDRASYLRYPDGHSVLLGQGSLGVDQYAVGELISENGSHIIFQTGGIGNGVEPAVQLEPGAAPDGTRALYDRTSDGTLNVVSLKPDGSPFGAGEDVSYRGASLDGVGVVFEVGKALYLSHDDAKTFQIGEGVELAGVAEGGGRVFYVENGNLKAFDVQSEASIQFSQSGDVTPVMVAGDGQVAYFVSPSILTAAPNPNGEEAQSGQENLYRSAEGQIAFVGTVTQRDVNGEGGQYDGLGFWLLAIEKNGTFGRVPARSTPDGGVLLFQSRAKLTAYDSEGHAEIYRYDAVAGELSCLSCNPVGPASSDAALQYENNTVVESHTNAHSMYDLLAWPENLRADGRRAFFESSEALVANDTDGLRDVYEWEAQGVGSCAKPNGCVYLISSGDSGSEERLWAVSESGDDVFFISGDLLAGGDSDPTPSIYDARVDGGFAAAPAPAAECLGEACQPSPGVFADLTPASFTFQGFGDAKTVSQRAVHKAKHKKAKHKKRHKKHRRRKKHHGHRGGRGARVGHGKGRTGR